MKKEWALSDLRPAHAVLDRRAPLAWKRRTGSMMIVIATRPVPSVLRGCVLVVAFHASQSEPSPAPTARFWHPSVEHVSPIERPLSTRRYQFFGCHERRLRGQLLPSRVVASSAVQRRLRSFEVQNVELCDGRLARLNRKW
jgi:hypothetical protein